MTATTKGRRKATTGAEPAAPRPPMTPRQVIGELDATLKQMARMDGDLLRKQMDRIHVKAATLAAYEDAPSVAQDSEDLWTLAEKAERLSARVLVARDALRELARLRDANEPAGAVAAGMLAWNAKATLEDIPSPVGVGDPFRAASIHSRRFGRAESRRDIDDILRSAAEKIAGAPGGEAGNPGEGRGNG